MSTALTFSMAGGSELSQSFLRYAEDIKDATEPFNQIADDFKQIVAGQAGSQGGKTGVLPASSPNYPSWKARNNPVGKTATPPQPLQSSSGGNAFTVDIQPLQISLGANSPVDITDADEQRWTAILQRWLIKKQNEDFAS